MVPESSSVSSILLSSTMLMSVTPICAVDDAGSCKIRLADGGECERFRFLGYCGISNEDIQPLDSRSSSRSALRTINTVPTASISALSR